MAGDASRRNGKLGGIPKGYKYPKTLAKERAVKIADEIARQIVLDKWAKIIEAQAEHAQGVSYMVLRAPDGSFVRATDVKQLDAALAAGEQSFRIFTQAPNTQAFTALSDRTFDKPIERHEVTGAEGGPLVIKWQD